MSVVRCINCEFAVMANAVCPYCGQSTSERVAAPLSSCERCGAAMSAVANRCACCGAKQGMLGARPLDRARVTRS